MRLTLPQTNHFNIGSLMERGIRLIGNGQATMRTPVPVGLTAALWAAIHAPTSRLTCQEALSPELCGSCRPLA